MDLLNNNITTFEITNFSSIFKVGDYFFVFTRDGFLNIYQYNLENIKHRTRWYKNEEYVKPSEIYLSLGEHMLVNEIYPTFTNLEILLQNGEKYVDKFRVEGATSPILYAWNECMVVLKFSKSLIMLSDIDGNVYQKYSKDINGFSWYSNPCFYSNSIYILMGGKERNTTLFRFTENTLNTLDLGTYPYDSVPYLLIDRDYIYLYVRISDTLVICINNSISKMKFSKTIKPISIKGYEERKFFNGRLEVSSENFSKITELLQQDYTFKLDYEAFIEQFPVWQEPRTIESAQLENPSRNTKHTSEISNEVCSVNPHDYLTWIVNNWDSIWDRPFYFYQHKVYSIMGKNVDFMEMSRNHENFFYYAGYLSLKDGYYYLRDGTRVRKFSNTELVEINRIVISLKIRTKRLFYMPVLFTKVSGLLIRNAGLDFWKRVEGLYDTNATFRKWFFYFWYSLFYPNVMI